MTSFSAAHHRHASREALEQRQLLTGTGVSSYGAPYATEGSSYTIDFSATSTGGSSALTGYSISWGDGTSSAGMYPPTGAARRASRERISQTLVNQKVVQF